MALGETKESRSVRHRADGRRLRCLAACIGLALRCAGAEEPLGVSTRPGETTVRIWAPNARSVELVGEFNGWKASPSERLSPVSGRGLWTVTLPRSRPSGPYRFLVNGNLPRRDPYARAVSADGRSSWFYDPAAFAWEEDWPPAVPLDDLVLYELHVGAYHDPKPQDGRPATFHDAIKRLDHLVELGVSAVLLMPVHEFNGNHSWGYNPCDLFAVEQAYGGPDGLKHFVKACHRHGLAVHLDVVHNHYGPDNLDLLQFDGSGGERDGGPYFYDRPGLAQTPWGPRPRFEEPMVRRFILDNILMWITEYRVDGFRWDSPSNIRAYNQGSEPIPEGAAMLEEINALLRNRFPHVHSIAEDSMDMGGFHASWDFDFHHQVMPVLAATNDAERAIGALASALEARPAAMARVVYVDNHDEAGLINKQTRIASDVAPGHPAGDRARRLCALGAVLTLTAPGIPLILMGNEFQESGPFHDNRPLDWGKKQRHAGLVALHRDLIRWRRNRDGRNDSLKGAGIRTALLDERRNALVYWRWNERAPGRPMVVAMNLSERMWTNAPVPFPGPGPWETLLDTEWTRYGGGIRQEIARPFEADRATGRAPQTLQPYSAKLYAPASGAVASNVPAAPEPAVSSRQKAVSLFSSMQLTAGPEGGAASNWPMTLVEDFLWEARVEWPWPDPVELRVSADTGVHWGAPDDQILSAPFRVLLKRRGPPLRVEAAWDGPCLVRFNDDTLEFVVKSAPAFREWTGVSGRTVEARLIAIEGEQVILERSSGQRMSIAVQGLSDADRDYLRSMRR